MLIIHGWELLAPFPTPKLELENRPFSAACDYLFNILAVTRNIRNNSPPSATRGRAMSWRRRTYSRAIPLHN